MVTFPDHSAQEQIIRTSEDGKVELLYKAGTKILRFNKSRWGSEEDVWKYGVLKPYVKGRCLNVGMGMGLSVEMILAKSGVTELVVYEWESDVATIYTEEHTADPKLKIEVKDAHVNKPTGTFDFCLYELPMNSQGEYDKSKSYLKWIWNRMNSGGYMALPYDRFSQALMMEFPSLSWITLAAPKDKLPQISPIFIWAVVEKP